ncbi:MAG: cell division protein ZapA [Acetobacteraceae bacterium]|nr:cell division protein ZapA [Acetobacteraceae bacterium]
MGQVQLKINGHMHTVGCKDGEEEHLTAMGAEVEKRIEKVKALGMNSGESKVLAMAALFLADELHDLAAELETARRGKPGTPERNKSEKVARLAARAEAIAAAAEEQASA